MLVPTQMRAYEERWRWGRDDPSTGPSSRLWKGQWETSGQWDKVGGNWGSDGSTLSKEHDNIMQWDDSGAQEALHIAKERYEASSRGLIYPVSLPSPDLYIQIVDWDTQEAFDLPESADALAAREETKGQRKRVYKGGRCERERRGIKRSDRQDKVEFGNLRKMKNEKVLHSTGRHNLQKQLGQSGWDHPTPDTDYLPDAPTQDRPVVSGWGEVQPPQLQLLWQDQTMGHCDWLHNPRNQPSCEGLQWSTGHGTVQGGWIYWNDLDQTLLGTQNGCSTVHYQTIPKDAGHWSPGMCDARSSGWSVQNPHHPGRGHWQQDNKGPGLQQPYVGLSNRWQQPKQQWHYNKPH